MNFVGDLTTASPNLEVVRVKLMKNAVLAEQ
jgi:hypothetical protein